MIGHVAPAFAVLSYAPASPSIYFFHPDGSAGPVQPVSVGSGTTLLSAAISMNRSNGNLNLAWLQDKPLRQKPFYSSASFQAFLQRYANDGSVMGKPAKVFTCTDTQYTSGKSYGCNANALTLAQDDSGNSEVAWWENNYKGAAITSYINARGFTSTNASDSGKTPVSPAASTSASVASPPVVKVAVPAAFIVGWTSQDNSVGIPMQTSVTQTIGLNGILFGSPTQFPANLPATGTAQSLPAFAGNSAGNVVTLWPGRTSDFSQAWIQGQFYLQQ